MGLPALHLSIEEVVSGGLKVRPDMPVWLSRFADDVWTFRASSSPLYKGAAAESIVWRDYIEGRGATLGHPNSRLKTKYEYCLSREIVDDLKIAALIYSQFPRIVHGSKSSKTHLDPSTVKGRIEELAKIFSIAVLGGRARRRVFITRLSQIPFDLLLESILEYRGRGSHLKRALKLISDPAVQINLSAGLQWRFLDITCSSIVWPESKDLGGIKTLPDSIFLFLLDFCKRAVARFKWVRGMTVHDSDCSDFSSFGDDGECRKFKIAFDSYVEMKVRGDDTKLFSRKHEVSASDILSLIRDAHSSAMLIVLMFTGMRASELLYLMNGAIVYEYGYWFLKSKVVKHRPKDAPVSEGWLAIDIVRDAYDVLSYFCSLTKNPYLFSSPFPVFASDGGGYHASSLNTKFSRWFEDIDVGGVLRGWTFSLHQCRETLVSQMAKQEVGLPFISMQLNHFQSQFSSMPNSVTAGYGQYRQQLMTSVSNRIAEAKEAALLDVYGENAVFAGGGAAEHKGRIDSFFAGLGLYGAAREKYIRDMARRGVSLMPTSIGSCTRNFFSAAEGELPPCYGDYQCDPSCQNHVITERCSNALIARREVALYESEKERNPDFKVVWLGLAEKLNAHIEKFQEGRGRG